MELEKIKAIIAEGLNIYSDSITEDTTFVDDLGADSLDIFQSVMLLKQFGQLNKNVTVRQSEI